MLKLSSNIELIFSDWNTNFGLSLSRYRLAVIQQKILSGKYVLLPLRIKFIKNGDLCKFRKYVETPDIIFGKNPKYPMLTQVVMPADEEDALVLAGLALLLFSLSYGRFPLNGYLLDQQVDYFHRSLRKSK